MTECRIRRTVPSDTVITPTTMQYFLRSVSEINEHLNAISNGDFSVKEQHYAS